MAIPCPRAGKASLPTACPALSAITTLKRSRPSIAQPIKAGWGDRAELQPLISQGVVQPKSATCNKWRRVASVTIGCIKPYDHTESHSHFVVQQIVQLLELVAQN
ncbi:Uncharacterised protein [Vibrio cholerae]|nr:Uncharacterised protein [Vibrio cholerae]CSB52528.1 Uncharacterised protein [Vibrio cholerae]CSB79555.1 Uncharacterised protein [Vibrio cholerae]CSC01889.1 Uncharacterised protein [Vibrio cholerae]CSI67291.1 Uncharacterised protein [Vibrio cholerae]